MALRYDYLESLYAQCDSAFMKHDLKLSQQKFSEICRNLSRDFLPPIEREDIAAISYLVFNIASKYKKTVYPDEIKKQILSMKEIIKGIFTKNKACGDEIRRLSEINIKFETQNSSWKEMNDLLGDFFKTALYAYFRNL